jgi:PPM family protein phosphatase
MLRVAEHAERTDTGRHRRTNEDAYVARAPLFAVADGMGGAQAGEVAAAAAAEIVAAGLPSEGGTVEDRLRLVVQDANVRIHELSLADEERAGMGTTLTAAHVGEREVTIAHVGDSRCYRLRDGELERLTVDHTLVEELVRQGRIDPSEAHDHPQRSVVTRVLGPEALVRVDSLTFPGRDGDVFLICSDGLTTMLDEDTVAGVLRERESLRGAATRLVALANEAGGRDNITVVLFRLEDLGDGSATDEHTQAIPADEVRAAVAAAAAATPGPADPVPAAAIPDAPTRAERIPRSGPAPRRRRRRVPGVAIAAIVLGAILVAGGYLATQAVYFVGVDNDGFVTVYRGVPYDVLGVSLYSDVYSSGVSSVQMTPRQRATVIAHDLRSRDDADDLVRQLELGRVGSG